MHNTSNGWHFIPSFGIFEIEIDQGKGKVKICNHIFHFSFILCQENDR